MAYRAARGKAPAAPAGGAARATPGAQRGPARRPSLLHAFRLLPPIIWIPLFAVLLASLAITTLSEWSARHARASGERVAEVLQRLDAVGDLKSLVVDVETGQRGYLLTRDPVYLEPFAQAVANLPKTQRLVRELTAGTPELEERVARVSDLVARRVADATRIVDTFNEGRTAEALALLRAGEGRRLMDEFRAEVAALEAQSQAELFGLQRAQASSAFWGRLSLIVMTLVTLVLLLMLTRLFVAEAIRQERRRSAAEHEAKELEKLVEARTRELSDLSTHLQEFSEKEKSELAHNLHDELGGLLTAAKMDLSWLQSRVEQPLLQQRLAQLGKVLDDAMDLKRRVVEDLRPSLLDHFGLPTALRAYFESACAKAGMKCELAVSGDDEPVAREVAIAIFRIVQEGLTNAIRHADARSVRLEFGADAAHFRLKLSDDGRGIDLQNPAFRWSHGLTGMRHRIRALGGRFEIHSAPGKGTTLLAEVPRQGRRGR